MSPSTKQYSITIVSPDSKPIAFNLKKKYFYLVILLFFFSFILSLLLTAYYFVMEPKRQQMQEEIEFLTIKNENLSQAITLFNQEDFLKTNYKFDFNKNSQFVIAGKMNQENQDSFNQLFLAKYNRKKEKIWEKKFSQVFNEDVISIVIDSKERIYVLTNYLKLDEKNSTIIQNVFYVFDEKGKQIIASPLATDKNYYLFDMNLDPRGNSYVSGVYQNENQENIQVFIRQIKLDTENKWVHFLEYSEDSAKSLKRNSFDNIKNQFASLRLENSQLPQNIQSNPKKKQGKQITNLYRDITKEEPKVVFSTPEEIEQAIKEKEEAEERRRIAKQKAKEEQARILAEQKEQERILAEERTKEEQNRILAEKKAKKLPEQKEKAKLAIAEKTKTSNKSAVKNTSEPTYQVRDFKINQNYQAKNLLLKRSTKERMLVAMDLMTKKANKQIIYYTVFLTNSENPKFAFKALEDRVFTSKGKLINSKNATKLEILSPKTRYGRWLYFSKKGEYYTHLHVNLFDANGKKIGSKKINILKQLFNVIPPKKTK